MLKDVGVGVVSYHMANRGQHFIIVWVVVYNMPLQLFRLRVVFNILMLIPAPNCPQFSVGLHLQEPDQPLHQF